MIAPTPAVAQPIAPARGLRWLTDPMWGPRILMASAAVILLVFLGSPTLWTLEGRTAVICREMMRSGDYFHPYLFDDEYYDKPLVPYWMVIAVARLTGRLNEFAMRLPGVLAALLAIYSTWRIGKTLFGPASGLLAGWLLTTCYIFTYWARIASSDILNVSAVLASVAWYAARRDSPGFVTNAVLFLLCAVGAQMKGLIAPVLVMLAIAPDLLRNGRLRAHLRWSLLPTAAVVVLIYLAPFVVSSVTADGNYQSSGLAMAVRENIVRYFRPFDHHAPFYEYARYLPFYALPWTLFLLGVLWRVRQWKDLGASSRWILEIIALILLFLTLSGSRRHYYMLPVLPFTMLAVADWLCEEVTSRRTLRKVAWWTVGLSASGLVVYFGVVTPILVSRGGARVMAAEIRGEAQRRAPWTEWRVVLFDTRPQMGYYLDPATRPRRLLTRDELREALRIHPRTVVVTYSRKAADVESVLGPADRIVERSTLPWSLGQPKMTSTSQVAFVPRGDR